MVATIDVEKQIGYYTKCLELDSNNLEAWYNKGFALAVLKKYEEAIKCYDKALGINPKTVGVWNSKAFALRALGRYEEAIRCFDKELEINPKGGIWWSKGFTLYKCSRYEEAIKCFDKALEEDPNNISAREYKGIASIESEIAKIKSAGVKIPKSKELIEQAKSELNKHNFERAKELAEEAKKRASERKSGYDSAFRLISEVKRILNETKNKGVIISDELLTKSKQAFNNGEYEESVRLAEELKNLVNNTEIKYREARDWIKSAESSIERAREFGCKVSEAENLLNKADSAFNNGNYTDAVSYAKQAEETAKRIREESKPEITIKLSETSFKTNAWKRIDLIFKNNGTATAKEINVEYPKERIEIEDLTEIKELNPKEEKKLRIGLRPIHTGEVPLKTEIRYKDLDNKEYKEEKTFWITVGEEAKEYKKEQIEITIERAIYDPCKRDFIEKPLPRMKEWINRYDPSAYWFVISIQNNTDRAIEEWGVELETSAALKIKESKIEGIEIEIPYEAHLNSFKMSVPKEYGIVIPKGGAQRVYFKLRADKPKTAYEISGVFKSEITGDVPIRAKEFKYLCDVGVLPEAVKAELKKTFSEKDAAKLVLSFKIVQEIDRMCNTGAKTEEYIDRLSVLRNYTEGFSDKFTTQVDEFSRFMKQEQLEYLDEEYKVRVRRFCTNLVDVWVSEFLKG